MYPLLQSLMQKTREIIQNIQLHLQLKQTFNPYALKLLSLLEELDRFVLRLLRRLHIPEVDVQEELSVIYRADDEIDEISA